MARLVGTTAGSSCGGIPTAIASENSSASMIGLCSATLMMKMDVVNAPPIYTRSMENRRSPTWNSVSSWWVLSPAAIGVLVGGQGLAGQHGLVAFQAGDLHQADVGRDDVAEPQLDEVTGHQRGHIHG